MMIGVHGRGTARLFDFESDLRGGWKGEFFEVPFSLVWKPRRKKIKHLDSLGRTSGTLPQPVNPHFPDEAQICRGRRAIQLL
jgi:hypothetical protein